jgi:hypothetical protein
VCSCPARVRVTPFTRSSAARLRVPIPIDKAAMADAYKTHFCLCAQPVGEIENTEDMPKWYFASNNTSLQAACWTLTELDTHDTLVCPGSHCWIPMETNVRRREADVSYTSACCPNQLRLNKTQRRSKNKPLECMHGDACTRCHVFAEVWFLLARRMSCAHGTFVYSGQHTAIGWQRSFVSCSKNRDTVIVPSASMPTPTKSVQRHIVPRIPVLSK